MYLHMHQTPGAWGCRAYLLVWHKREYLCGVFSSFFLPFHFYHYDGCLLLIVQVGLSGFASHRCSLYVEAGYQ